MKEIQKTCFLAKEGMHELSVSSDILPDSVPYTFSHSLVQPPVHICPQSHGHLHVVLSGPEQ